MCKFGEKTHLKTWRHTTLKPFRKTVSACQDRKCREENNTFYPTRRKKITHFAQHSKHSTTEYTHTFFSEISKVTIRMQHFCKGFGRITVGCPDSKCTVWAKHCWAHPRWGRVRSELSVLRPDVSCCLAKCRGREGRGGDYTTLFLLTLWPTKCKMLRGKWEAVNGLGKEKVKLR